MFGKRQKENTGNRKKGKKKKIVVAVVIVAVAGTAGSVVYSKTQIHTDDRSETREAKSAEVTLGNISNTIIGTGNLELDEAEAVYIPVGLTVEEVYVESGDHVSAGTVLATVSTSSVLDAVDDVQKELEELDEKISTCQDDDDENCIESSVSGRVKVIYAAADSDVTDVMLENGALMELSLDGKMAVDLTDVTDAEKGDSVFVTLSDGTKISGTVEKISENGNCTVTVTDNGTSFNDTVTVTDTDGNALGSGTLYIHEPLEITGTAGTVSSVSVSLNESVDAGDELLVLDGTSSDAEYEKLLATREARTATLNKLLQLVKNPEITAEKDGTIQDVNISADSTGTATTDSTSTSGNNAGNSSGSGYSKMSYSKTASANMINTGMTSTNMTYMNLACSRVVSDSVPTYQQMSFESAESEADAVVIDGEENSSDENKDSSSDTKTDDTNTTDSDNKGTSDSTTETDSTDKNTTEDAAESVTDNTVNNAPSGNSSTDNVTADNFSDGSQNVSGGNTTSGTENTGNTNTTAGGNTNSNAQNGTQNQNATAANTTTDAQNTTTTETSEKDTETDASAYSTDIEAFSVSGDENMCLSVSVDELDINSVEKGQTAVVTFDAIENKEFQGEVTKIGSTASVNGGVAKYTVEITIPKDDEMKQGMNASATITTEERKDVLTLPMNALQEKGDKTFVYTEQDSEGNLTGETEIQTGLTDGSTVEITDGLKEGDTVYYMRSDNTSSDSSSSNEMPDMSGGPGGNGDMPGGDFGGGSDGNSGGGPGGNGGGAPGGGQGGPGM